MTMNSVQASAFKVASGNLDVNVLYLVCTGTLLGFLFFWAAWAMSDVWTGWSNEKIRNAALVRFAIRTVILLVISIWMLAS